ncbi:MAG: hypothetical protein ABI759_10840 [Candidatus Solibacter sp.]
MSRLRVGGDGDYCSKEHRNQHRLRQGMDRLEEASKVTSLMRRRENPRHISSAQLMRNSAKDPRGFYDGKVNLLQTQMTAFAPLLPGPAAARVVVTAEHYVTPRRELMKGVLLAPRATGSSIHISDRGNAAVVPERRLRMAAKVTRASMVELHCITSGVQIARRDFGMARGRKGRTYLRNAWLTPDGGAARRALSPYLRPQRVPANPVEGKALRVSIGIGFKVAKVSWRSIGRYAVAPVALVFADLPRRLIAERHDEMAAPRTLEMRVGRSARRLPGSPNEAGRAQFVIPGSVAQRRRNPPNGASPVKRSTDVAWRVAEPQSKKMAVLPETAGFAKRNGAHLFPLVLSPTTKEMERQVAFTAFIPQEPSGCPKVGFEGAVATAIVGASQAVETADPGAGTKATAEMVRIEEHFGEGWDDWVGGTAEWKVDVAGVRTGPLALYKPSLELIDYEMEFLARIDTRSLNWVVRAAGLDEYVCCTLTALAGGELEFSRTTVVGNLVQKEVRSSQRTPGKPRTAMTVGTRVTGDTFAVSVDGTDIDFWNDDRFPMGGIGFLGAPDDRARLYWVRLSSTELTAKEQQK